MRFNDLCVFIEGGEARTYSEAREITKDCVHPLLRGPNPNGLELSEVNSYHFPPVGVWGSSHLLKYRKKHFWIFTRHQVLPSSKEVTEFPYLLIPETEQMLGFSVFQSIPDDEQETSDLAAVLIDEISLKKHSGLEKRFFELSPICRHPNEDRNDKWVAIGFPQKLAKYDNETEPHTFHRTVVEIVGQPVPADRQRIGGTCTLEIFADNNGKIPLDGKFDGLSGAPVFAWSGERQDLYYRGIVIKGGGNFLTLIREVLVRRFLDAIIERYLARLHPV